MATYIALFAFTLTWLPVDTAGANLPVADTGRTPAILPAPRRGWAVCSVHYSLAFELLQFHFLSLLMKKMLESECAREGGGRRREGEGEGECTIGDVPPGEWGGAVTIGQWAGSGVHCNHVPPMGGGSVTMGG